MRIIQLTPGTGNFYCGSCLRDNALVNEHRRMGHDALLVPLYLPTVIDEPSAEDAHIYYGGINVYLEQRWGLYSRLPGWIQRLLDSPRLLRWAANRADMTKPNEVGELTLSMLQGAGGHQARELAKLVTHLKDDLKPDIVVLSNVLLIGMAGAIRRALNVPVVCTLHGEDTFIEGLPGPYNEQAWALLREQSKDVDAFIAVSRYYGQVMHGRLGLAAGRLHVVLNGIMLDGFAPADQPPTEPTIGYLARMCTVKGVKLLTEAFIELKRRGRVPGAKLRVAGSQTSADEATVQQCRDMLAKAGVSDDAEFLPNVSRDEKLAFLRSLTVLSVPTVYDEAFGLYVIEALASGVPVVQPRRGAFPELIEATGGGVLCEPDNPIALADALESLLLDADKAGELGRRGRQAVLRDFSVKRMAGDVMAIYEQMVRAHEANA